ncbi:MAG: DUF4440 domain-containing protein, partial [Rhodothermales bacterium]|nr:DUF4440 domain-containing protein [Rhodothermales bacterium]
DAEGIASFYAPDARSLMPTGEVRDGYEAIREGHVEFFSGIDYTLLSYDTPDVLVSGDLGVTVGAFDEFWVDRATGDTTAQRGQWLLVWEQQPDGSWRIAREMWTREQES